MKAAALLSLAFLLMFGESRANPNAQESIYGTVVFSASTSDAISMKFQVLRIDAPGNFALNSMPNKLFEKPEFRLKWEDPKLEQILAERGPRLGRSIYGGEVLTKNLAPGTYVITNLICETPGPVRELQSFPIKAKFTIESGNITYLGEFRASPLIGKNMLGIASQHGWYVTHFRDVDRDMQIAKQKGVATGATILDMSVP